MIDHVSIAVSDLARASAFYDAVLDSLGFKRLVTREGTVGFGKQYPELWLNLRPEVQAESNPGAHIALRAPSEDAVKRCHAAAQAAGGRDYGAPGPRQAAMTAYFGAFIGDPDGNKIEFVTFPRSD